MENQAETQCELHNCMRKNILIIVIHPDVHLINSLSHFETGSVTPAKRSRQKTKCDEEAEIFVLAAVVNNSPHVSCRQIASQCVCVSVKSVWKI